MTREYITIGSSPIEEDCVQVGTENYMKRSNDECHRFILLIRKKNGDEPVGASLRIKMFTHDFGTYCEVVCYYDENNEEATEYAFDCETNTPMTWEDQ